MDDEWLYELLGVEKKRMKSIEFQPGELVSVAPDGRIGVVMGFYWEHSVEDWRYRVFLDGRLSISSHKVLKRVQL